MLTYADTLDGKPPVQRKRTWWRIVGRNLPILTVVVLASMLLVTTLWPYVVITVPSGQVGVLWRRFYGFDIYCWCFVGRGTTLDPRELRQEGLHLVWPWDILFLYNLRLQSSTQTYNAISKDGVNVSAQINVRFQLLHDSVAVLHKFIGPNYYQAVVAPEIGSQAREVISRYTAQEVYTSRKAIQEEIRDSAQASLGAHLNKLVQPEAMEELDPKHYNDFLQHAIQILDTLVLSIELPPEIVAAINRQTDQYYQIQEAKYRVEREAEESERKQIEANGIAAFQQTVSQGISDSYLRWRGIEATLLLAQSPNAKIVVIGTGKDGLPIILGNVDTPLAPGPTPQLATPPAAVPATPAEPKPKGDDSHPGGGASNETEPTTKSADASAGSAGSGPVASSSGPLSLSDIKSTLSRITGALRSAGSDSSPAADVKVKP
jgi:regulator of protease activity HflC (stomatin/prohibitin superfamily)